MRCLKLSKYSVISWIRTYLNRRLPHLIFKIRLCLILKSGHFLEVTSICHKQFSEAMPLGSNPGPFDQAPVDVSGFTSGPCRGQGRKEGDSWDHTLSPDLPEWRWWEPWMQLSSLFSQSWQKIAGWEPGCCRPCTPPSPLFHPHSPNKVMELRRRIKRCPFCSCRQSVWVCCVTLLLLGWGRADLLPTNLKTGWWLCHHTAFEELLALFSLKGWNG